MLRKSDRTTMQLAASVLDQDPHNRRPPGSESAWTDAVGIHEVISSEIKTKITAKYV